MKVVGKQQIVTSELMATVQTDIDEEQEQRQARLEAAIRSFGELSQGLAHSEHVTMLDVTKALWLALMSLGLLSVEYAICVRRRPPAQTTLHDEFGGSWKYRSEKTFTLRSIFGQGTYRSSRYVRGNKPRPDREVAAINSEIGLLSVGGGLCPVLALHCVDMSSRMPFDTAASVLKKFLGYAPSKRSLQGLVDLVGPLARQCLDQAPCPRGDILLVMVDCRGLPYVTSQELQRRCKPHVKRKNSKPSQLKRPITQSKPRRGPGKKKASRRVTVGLIIALHTDAEGNVVQKGERFYCSSFGNMEAVFSTLEAKLAERPENSRLLSLRRMSSPGESSKAPPPRRHRGHRFLPRLRVPLGSRTQSVFGRLRRPQGMGIDAEGLPGATIAHSTCSISSARDSADYRRNCKNR